jgi:hypothetical protein
MGVKRVKVELNNEVTNRRRVDKKSVSLRLCVALRCSSEVNNFLQKRPLFPAIRNLSRLDSNSRHQDFPQSLAVC